MQLMTSGLAVTSGATLQLCMPSMYTLCRLEDVYDLKVQWPGIQQASLVCAQALRHSHPGHVIQHQVWPGQIQVAVGHSAAAWYPVALSQAHRVFSADAAYEMSD